MLRRRSRAVAKHSQHMLGKAMDFYLPDVPTARIREIGMRLQRGGVGFYPDAHTPFVHLDVGSVRSWPRMTRDQLVRLFPDEKTVHLPADGKPLAGYEIAKAEILSGGGAVIGYASADVDEGAVIASGRKSLWAALFGGDDEEADARPTRGRRARADAAADRHGLCHIRGYSDSNSDDGGRFAVAAVARAVDRARSRASAPSAWRRSAAAPRRQRPPPRNRLPPTPPAQPQQRPPQDNRPRLIDAPLPLARPRGLLARPARCTADPDRRPARDRRRARLCAAAGPAGDQRSSSPRCRRAGPTRSAAATERRRRRQPDQCAAAADPADRASPTPRSAWPARHGCRRDRSGSRCRRASSSPCRIRCRRVRPRDRRRQRSLAASQRSVPSRADADRAAIRCRSLRPEFAVRRPWRAATVPPGRPVTVATARTRTTGPSRRADRRPEPGRRARLQPCRSERRQAPAPSAARPSAPLPTNFVQN